MSLTRFARNGRCRLRAAYVVVPLGLVTAAGSVAGEPRRTDTTAQPVVDEVIVTGTNIRGVESAPAVSVQIVDRAQLEQSGAGQMADLIKSVPSNNGTTLYNESGQLSGTAQFVLRGLGFSSTLTLLNGRRAGISPISDRTGADFLDINQFPLSMVERIEVLKDGATAIYGSEAVAGVVNIITRKGFDGIELSGNFETSTNEAYSANLAVGRRFDRGSVNLYATYYGQNGNLRSDFPWLVERVGGNGTPGLSQLINSNAFPTSWQRATTNAAGQPLAVAGAPTVADPNCIAAGGVFPISAAGVTNTSQCFFDFTDQVALTPAINRAQVFIEGDFQLGERLSFFNETSASRNLNKIASQPGTFSNGAGVGGLAVVPASHPFNFFVADPAAANRIIAINPAQWNPAIHQAVAVVGALRPEGQYANADKRQINTYLRAVNGLELSLSSTWRAGLSHQYAYAEFKENNPILPNATALNALLQSGQYNPFGTSVVSPTLVSPKNGTSRAGNSQAVLSQFFYTSNVSRITEQQVFDLSASGALFDLPVGTVSAAVGAQYRKQTLDYTPDPISAVGLGTTASREAAFSQSLNVRAAYAEAVVPIHERAQLQAAVRHEDYGGQVGSSTDPKLTARLNVIPEMLALRGSWGTSFQAPTLTQNASQTVLAFVNDPVILTANGLGCGPASSAFGTVFNTRGGNLQPQDSENFNLGIDYQPSADLKLSADLWRYDYQNLIAAGQNAQAIITGQCVNGVYVPDPRVVRDPLGLPREINTSYANVGKVVAEGVDFAAFYATRIGGLGEFSLQTDLTYINAFDVYGANGIAVNKAGNRNFTNNFSPMPRLRGSARSNLTRGIQQLSLGVNYTGGYDNDQSNNGPVASFTTVDLQYTLRLENLLFAGSTTLSVGMNNALDKDPPALRRNTVAGQLISGTNLDYDRPGYDALSGADIRGRIVYARFTQRF